MISPDRDGPAVAVALTNVRKVFGGSNGSNGSNDNADNTVVALAGVTVEFRHGTFTAVMGPSGSGKSTLLHCAAGLDRPTSGSVMLDGKELTEMRETALTKLRRERVGFVFQAFNLLPALTVLENVTLPLELAGTRIDRDRCATVLNRVGLGDRTGHLPGQLSGGQQQRVAIARALVTEPAVIFADEPTGQLDSRSSQDVLELLRECVDSAGQTLVMVTHDPVAAAFADRVVFLADGQVVDELAGPTSITVAEHMTRLTAVAAGVTGAS